MGIEELQVYQMAMTIGDRIWEIVRKWDYFSKDTIGKQFTKAADSIAANISEGYGRFHYNENRLFCYYSRGSLYETRTWLKKAYSRNLITEKDFNKLLYDIDNVAVRLNNYIRSINPGKKR